MNKTIVLTGKVLYLFEELQRKFDSELSDEDLIDLALLTLKFADGLPADTSAEIILKVALAAHNQK